MDLLQLLPGTKVFLGSNGKNSGDTADFQINVIQENHDQDSKSINLE